MSKELIEQARNCNHAPAMALCHRLADHIEELDRKVARHDAEVAELNRKVFALKTPCVVALAALEDFNEQAKWQHIFSINYALPLITPNVIKSVRS